MADELRIGLAELLHKARMEHNADFLREGVRRFLCLPLPMASESFYGPLREVYGASAGILRLRGYKPATASHPQ